MLEFLISDILVSDLYYRDAPDMRRSTRNQSVVEKGTTKKNEIVEVNKPKRLAATDSFVRLKGSSDDETENKPAASPKRTRRNSARLQERPSSSNLKVSNTPTRRSQTPQATPRKPTPRKATPPPCSTSKPRGRPRKDSISGEALPATATPATKSTTASLLRDSARKEHASTPGSIGRAKARAQMAEDAEGEASSSSSRSSSSSDDEEHPASDYSKSDSGEEEEIEADKSDEGDGAVEMEAEDLSSDDDTRKRRRRGVSATPRKNKNRIVGHVTPSAKRNLQQRRAANSWVRMQVMSFLILAQQS